MLMFAIPTMLSGFILAGCVVSYSNIVESAIHDPASVGKLFSKETLEKQAIDYAKHPERLMADIKKFKTQFNKIVSLLERNVGKEWGKKNTELPSKEVYVKYTDSYLSRAQVDFNKGKISVATLDVENPEESLKRAIVTTLLTPEDPERVDLFSDKEITLKGKPYLADLVKDNKGKSVLDKKQANDFAEYLLENNLKTTEIKEKNLKKQVHYVQFPMVLDYKAQSKHKYGEYVSFYSKAYKLEEALVFAIIKTESAFNPYAVSYVPAYGLMQIVPTSAGKDVYRELNNKIGIPSKEMLFVPKTNIQYGTTYLNILFTRYLTGITNSLSHEYCVIAAYNTGSGNVLNAFDRNRTKAMQKINSMTSAEVYRHLRTNLKYEEARNYLHTVTNNKKKFQKTALLEVEDKFAESQNNLEKSANIAVLENPQRGIPSL